MAAPDHFDPMGDEIVEYAHNLTSISLSLFFLSPSFCLFLNFII